MNMTKAWVVVGLLAWSMVARAAEPDLVPQTYAHTELRWERLERGAWKPVQAWRQPKMKAGQTYIWDTTVNEAGQTERLLLRVTWVGQSPRVEVAGGFAYLAPEREPVRIKVDRGLADGQAWTFGVPTAHELVGHRVVTTVRLETVMEPRLGEPAATR